MAPQKLRAQTIDSLGVLTGGRWASTASFVLLKHRDPFCTSGSGTRAQLVGFLPPVPKTSQQIKTKIKPRAR